MQQDDSESITHLHAVLFREAKIILSKYEEYLRDKITSKQLAEKMLNLRDVINRIENYDR